MVEFEVWLSVLVDAALISNATGWDTNLVYNFARLLEPISDMAVDGANRLKNVELDGIETRWFETR